MDAVSINIATPKAVITLERFSRFLLSPNDNINPSTEISPSNAEILPNEIQTLLHPPSPADNFTIICLDFEKEMRSAENPKRIRPRFLVRSDTPFLASIVSLFTPRAFDTSFVSWAEIPAKAITIAPIAAILAKIVPAALHKGPAFISDNF